MVLVDTTIWSLALRRRETDLSASEKRCVEAWAELVRSGRAALCGPVRQELLSGIRGEDRFEILRERLSDFRYLEIVPADYDSAALFFNRCRAKGIAPTAIDMLLCALAHRYEVPIFTTDQDFPAYARQLPLRLFDAV